jgi:hypothetical protein
MSWRAQSQAKMDSFIFNGANQDDDLSETGQGFENQNVLNPIAQRIVLGYAYLGTT